MKNKTLVLIMAAGKGTRMQPYTRFKPKAVVFDDIRGEKIIDASLSHLRYKSESLDFFFLSRREFPFEVLNSYLTCCCGLDKSQILFQTVDAKGKDHVGVFWLEYIQSLKKFIFSKESRRFARTIGKYDNILIIPADHYLTSDHINLEDMVVMHKSRDADLTAVYCKKSHNENKGYSSFPEKECTAKDDLLTVEADNRVSHIKRDDGSNDCFYENHLTAATSIGIYLVKRPMLLRFDIGWRSKKQWEQNKAIDFNKLGVMAYAHFIDYPGYGRDTPQSIRYNTLEPTSKT